MTTLPPLDDINPRYHDTHNIFTSEEIDAANEYADWWYYTNDQNTIPADVKSKDDKYISILKSWTEYQNKAIPQETFERWKSLGLFAYGIAIITGEIYRGKNKGRYTTVFDFDQIEALQKYCEYIGCSIEELAHWSRMEWHEDPTSHHLFLITNHRFKNVGAGHGLEVYGEKKLIFVSNSMHPSGKRWTQKDSESLVILTNSLDLMTLEGVLERFMMEATGVSYLSEDQKDQYMDYLERPNLKLTKGHRYPGTWSKAKSLFFKFTGEFTDDVSDEIRYEKLVEWHNQVCDPSLFQERGREGNVPKVWKDVCKLYTGKREKERNEREDAAKQVKEEAKKHAPNMVEKKQIIVASLQEDIRKQLLENIWTRVSEQPEKFIITRRKEGDICRATVSTHYVTIGYDKSGEAEKEKTYQLSYGTTVFRVFPIQITMHESPLKFLESPPTYSIEFENQSNKRFTLTGSTEQIIQRLKEMSGCVVNAYGVSEVLTSVIGAFEDDGKLIVDKSVDFEGYYYADEEIHTSKIDFDKKHPVRTKEEVLQCIEYLEKRIKFQVWQYNDRTIDRRDVFASAIQWAVCAPFNFVIKQLSPPSHKRYHRGFDMSGERDGGKTGLSQEMLSIHGNGGQKDADTIYSVPAGSANTDAKMGKVVSRTTYPIEISEIGKIEGYGRDEKLVETYKNAIESIKVRDGRKDNRYDAPFPGCSPIILNGNPFISKKGELLKRLHVIKYSKEDRHDRNPETPFNQLQATSGHLIKILGDWTMRWIWDNRQEELLSSKYDGYQIGRFAIHKFYEFAGKDVPEWLTLWITDTSLEELDIDDESLIRSILHNHVHETISTNSKVIGEYTKGLGILTLEQKIGMCLDFGLWSWIRKIRGGNQYYINTSILEIFADRLPDLSFKKLGENTGLDYIKDTEGRAKLECTKVQLLDFIGKEEEELKVDTSQSDLGGQKA